MENELALRLGVFFGLFALFALAEAVWPRRLRRQPRWRRWGVNWAISILDTVTTRAMAAFLPLLAVGAAVDAGLQGWGLFNLLDWPSALEFAAAILILDAAIWAQHLVMHKVPILWRMHRVHHADRDMDVSTAIRFHPLEIALSMVLKIGLVYLLGPTALAVVAFEVLLNGTALFNHANLRIPPRLDRALRWVIVTPDMHRIHHSTQRAEHDSNYGFSITLWDRLFRTYRADPTQGHDGMSVGLRWQDNRPSRLWWSLRLPFDKL